MHMAVHGLDCSKYKSAHCVSARLHLGHTVPAGLSPPRDGVVHDVVCHQKEGLQLRHTPAVSCYPVAYQRFIEIFHSQ